MDVRIYIPHLALRDYVQNILTVDVTLPQGIVDVVTPYPPSPFQSLLFYCDDPVSASRVAEGHFEKQPLTALTGPQFSRTNIMVHRQLRAIRVDFLPGGLHRLLGIPMHELFDEGFDAVHFFGAEMRDIEDQLQHLSNLEECKNIVERFLLHRATDFRVKHILPFDAAMRMLLKSNGSMTIEKTASLACLSIRQFERIANERIGMGPKTYARILKFSKAYRLREASLQLSWTKIAYEAGYYDQMHMIRDFKVFAGVNPSVIEQQLLSTPIRMQKDMRY